MLSFCKYCKGNRDKMRLQLTGRRPQSGFNSLGGHNKINNGINGHLLTKELNSHSTLSNVLPDLKFHNGNNGSHSQNNFHLFSSLNGTFPSQVTRDSDMVWIVVVGSVREEDNIQASVISQMSNDPNHSYKSHKEKYSSKPTKMKTELTNGPNTTKTDSTYLKPSIPYRYRYPQQHCSQHRSIEQKQTQITEIFQFPFSLLQIQKQFPQKLFMCFINSSEEEKEMLPLLGCTFFKGSFIELGFEILWVELGWVELGRLWGIGEVVVVVGLVLLGHMLIFVNKTEEQDNKIKNQIPQPQSAPEMTTTRNWWMKNKQNKIQINKQTNDSYNIQQRQPMSFQNSFGPDGSININVVPSFGRIVQLPEQNKVVTISEVQAWRARKGVLRQRPADFDPSRYVSFSTKEVVEDPVDHQHIHEYVERSRLSKRLGF